MGTGSYLIGVKVGGEGQGPNYGGAGSVGVSTGPEYGYPGDRDTSGGLGAMLGAGGGLFWSNADHFGDLAGNFQSTIIGTPWGLGLQIDKSSTGIWVISTTYGKGWGAGIFHLTTRTLPCSIWETKSQPVGNSNGDSDKQGAIAP